MKSNKVTVNPSIHLVAYSEAFALNKVAIQISTEIKIAKPDNIGSIIAYNLIVGLAIELYFKAIMIFGRNGIITKGHELKELYKEFPSYIKSSLEKYYKESIKEDESIINIVAITLSEKSPNGPQQPAIEKKYSTFYEAIDAYSDEFVRSRYIFEDVKNNEWIYIDYPFIYGNAMLLALRNTYNDLVDKKQKK
ncbi:MAG: hypothetical protein WC679_13015 [Bacteroidales bacterium]|jgi:hypothetical protein